MSVISQVEARAAECGFFETGYVEIDNLKYYQEVRQHCEVNTCRKYATSWACPPAIGTLEECKARVESYQKMLLFTKKYELEDSFDFEGMIDGLKDFKKTAEEFQSSLKGVLKNCIVLSNQQCARCEKCTYPDAPCRFPEYLHHSLEGYGFVVSDLANEAGVRYNNGANTVTYLGALLFRTDE